MDSLDSFPVAASHSLIAPWPPVAIVFPSGLKHTEWNAAWGSRLTFSFSVVRSQSLPVQFVPTAANVLPSGLKATPST